MGAVRNVENLMRANLRFGPVIDILLFVPLVLVYTAFHIRVAGSKIDECR